MDQGALVFLEFWSGNLRSETEWFLNSEWIVYRGGKGLWFPFNQSQPNYNTPFTFTLPKGSRYCRYSIPPSFLYCRYSIPPSFLSLLDWTMSQVFLYFIYDLTCYIVLCIILVAGFWLSVVETIPNHTNSESLSEFKGTVVFGYAFYIYMAGGVLSLIAACLNLLRARSAVERRMTHRLRFRYAVQMGLGIMCSPVITLN